ncbi:hypothetical protein ACFVY9_16060 [Streptomyces sp. NPDC059544]|uniref:hypothetical protein n=1 Tax=Streptomyces sp. NPDC059544 TaxID=3346861 RepID=UPI0036C1D9E9
MAPPPISSGAAADRIADALGTPKNVTGEKANATAFVDHRLLDRSLQVDPARNRTARRTTPARSTRSASTRT